MQNSNIEAYILKTNVLRRFYKLKERCFCINMLFDMQNRRSLYVYTVAKCIDYKYCGIIMQSFTYMFFKAI